MSETSSTSRARRWLRRGLRLMEHGLAIFGLGMLVYLTCFDLTRITSGSMAPTLRGDDYRTGDLVLTERVSLWFREPRRWEAISFVGPDRRGVMKRVIGLPGETVQMLRGGRIFIDGEELERPPELEHLKYFPFGKLTNGKIAECGDGYYVLGDDSRDSDDSRYNGPVARQNIIGRAWLIVAPKEHRGFVR